MNEILQKRIEEAAKTSITETLMSTPNYEFSPKATDMLECAYIKGAEDILNNQWISVEEGLPEKNTMCFVRKETEAGVICDTDYIDYEGKWFFNSNRTSINSMVITHWMCIPSLEGGEK